jgi:uncharacterized protein YndB with AHSA1/START domain
MSTHKVVIDIAAPPARVFRFLTDPGLLTRWIGGLQASEPLTAGGLRVGARSREILLERGRRSELVSEVTELQPERLLVTRLESSLLTAESRFELKSRAGGTVVHHRLVPRYRGVFRLLAPFFARTVQNKLQSDLARLRKLAEETGA